VALQGRRRSGERLGVGGALARGSASFYKGREREERRGEAWSRALLPSTEQPQCLFF
jgi:hypothetical protein